MKKIFLGGTVNGSDWRPRLIPMLNIGYYDPVVEEWTEEDYQREIYEREHCDYILYVISPKLNGFYSIAEMVDDSNKRPEKTLCCFLYEDDGHEFSAFQLKSLNAIKKMITQNKALFFDRLEEIAEYVNK